MKKPIKITIQYIYIYIYIYELIKQKKENAEKEYANTKIPYRVYSNKDYTQGFLKGEINAYNNMIQLLESSGELDVKD